MAFGVVMAIGAATAMLIADIIQAVNDPRVRRNILAHRTEDA
jgi:hypothetical protein